MFQHVEILTKFANKKHMKLANLHEDFAKKLLHNITEPSFNISESVLDYYNKIIEKDDNATGYLLDSFHAEQANFLALFSGLFVCFN